MLERLFQIHRSRTTVRTEVAAGFTTFLTMAYIVVVNPSILAEAGVPFEGALFATCIASAIAMVVMGLVANYPFALAPGMGLNAYFTYTVVQGLGVPWQTALGAVFLSGVAFLLLTAGRVRALVVDAVPATLKAAAAAGIGVFIAFLGLRNAGVVVASPATFVGLGRIAAGGTLLSLAGLVVTAALLARRVKSALIWGILGVSAAAMALGLAPLPEAVLSVPDAGSTFLALDIRGALALGFLDIVFVFLFVDLFDSVGTFMGLALQGGYLTPDGRIPRVNRALFADATGTVAGALLGTSTVTTYIESAAGIGEGGRTGLVAVVVAALFLLAAFAAPIAGAIPPIATAPALIVVGALMLRAVVAVPWDDMSEAVPAFLTILAMPLTFSIANGLALGFISYVLVKVLAGRFREVSPLVYLLAA
ncbi:MAG: NCS2 family permease, partial [Gemmatimonadetes bacterium]|nr:NCS2 family permease [Gemmatimonadota bacterium]